MSFCFHKFAVLAPTLVAVVFFLTCSGWAEQLEDRVDFNRHIKPLLSDRCFNCHGPDEEQRDADLNLGDKRLVFSHQTESGLPLVKAGDPTESELYRRITSEDPDQRMPPADSNRTLSADDVELIGRWIRQGAEWKPHWSLVALTPIQLPNVRDRQWTTNQVDSFIRARLEKEKLSPSPSAIPERLIRRVTLDLTGLPPSLDELDAFLSNDAPDAYQRAVDRLLASPRHGERMAVSWLDLARYADTSGYQNDRYRPVWPWRDWVLRALNSNMSFDRFVTWQLAGDLLPDATLDQRLATAFNRLHRQNEESGAVPEEFRSEYVADRVITFGTALLGLTMECARCHDHKYDPITQKEFYELSSFFDNIDESGVTSSETDAIPVPTLLLSNPSQQLQLDNYHRQIGEADRAIRDYAASGAARDAFERWFQRANHDPMIPGIVADYPLDTFDNEVLVNQADAAHPGRAEAWPQLVPAMHGNGIKLNGDTRLSFKEVGVFTRTDPFSFSLWIHVPKKIGRATILHRTKAALDAASRGYELLIEDGKLSFALVHMWPENALRVVTRQSVPVDKWTQVTWTYDGSSRAAGAKIYLNGRLAEINVVRDGLWKDILYERVDVVLTIGERWRDAGFKNGSVADFKIFSRALTPLEVAQLFDGRSLRDALRNVAADSSAIERENLLDYYLENFDTTFKTLRAKVAELRKKQSALVNPIPEMMVMKEMPQSRPTYLLVRGQYDQRGKQVVAGTPRSILGFADELPKNRAGLAQWLTNPKNPLTARVTVNRYWELLFGTGLVNPANDFGSQGNAPSHPQLLDWLAGHYIQSEWDTKVILRLLVNSSTYRQSSTARPELHANDLGNRLLTRGPKHRLSAEMIRDSVLAMSGLLVQRLGGEPVRPYQPAGLWKEKGDFVVYKPSKGAGLYRRSVYTIWKRTSPPPSMTAFDAPTRSVCTVRRERTGTPLQALVLMNDVQYVEAARCLAQRAMREGGSNPTARIQFAFRLVTSRLPGQRELQSLKTLYQHQYETYGKRPEDVKEFLNIGERPVDDSLDRVELASLATVAMTLLNLDEFVMKR